MSTSSLGSVISGSSTGLAKEGLVGANFRRVQRDVFGELITSFRCEMTELTSATQLWV